MQGLPTHIHITSATAAFGVLQRSTISQGIATDTFDPKESGTNYQKLLLYLFYKYELEKISENYDIAI
jgi:hypothetical protein